MTKLALFRWQRTPGAVALLWGFLFGLIAWAGAASLGLHGLRGILFGLVVWGSTALFVYLRGAALENPPAAQPGAFLQRPRAPRPHHEPAKRRELHRARVALADGDRAEALFFLREAAKVAVAQGKADELAEVRELQRSLGEHVPADPLPFGALLQSLRHRPVDAHGAKTRELAAARVALDRGDRAQALFLLGEASRVAIAQRRLGELLEVHDLVESISPRSPQVEALAHQVADGLRSFS